MEVVYYSDCAGSCESLSSAETTSDVFLVNDLATQDDRSVARDGEEESEKQVSGELHSRLFT